MIETYQLTKMFDEFNAVTNVTLTVGTGEVLALLGPNGAGKTTTVRMMTSILAPTSGWARVAGFDIVKEPEKVRSHVGVLTEQHGLYERMKGLEYLDFFGETYRLDKATRRQRARDLMIRFGLEDAMMRRVGDYSKGMKQKLALVRAMLHNPPVLLLDEPTSAMDPQSAKQVRDAIIELQRDEARTFLITTHNLNEAQVLANRIAIIRHGRIIANGSFEELSRQFAGDTVMELRAGSALNGFAETLSQWVTVNETGTDWLRYTVKDTATVNPQIIKHAVHTGVDVVSLTPLTRSLEDIYLQVVQEDEAQQERPHERTN